MTNDEFQLAPLPPDADTAEMLEAIGPLEERPAESQYCVFRSGRETARHAGVTSRQQLDALVAPPARGT